MNKKISSALISVFYKDGLETLVQKLHDLNVTIYSTGGTQQFIEALNIPCIPVESVTNYPSILGGRVKTLHPKIFGGILGRRNLDQDLQEMKEYEIPAIDLVIVDYITLVAAPKGLGADNLYTKGKSLAEGLIALGAKYKCPVITGVQVAKDAWNSSDITLESVPESKAIAETSDTFFAIIRTEEMKRQNIYRFKLLKQRDGDFLKSQIRLSLNPIYLTLENDQFIDQ